MGEQKHVSGRGSSTQKKRSWRRAGLIIAASCMFLVLFAATAVYVFLSGLSSEEGGTIAKEIPAPAPGERVHILVLGVDAEQPAGGGAYIPPRSDTIMLATFDPVTSEASALFIPRDTRVAIPGRPEPEKLGHAYAHGGARLAIETVSQFLDVPIHYYVRVDFMGFAYIVDAVGGVKLYVDRHLYYEDPAQDLVINIPEGIQHMDGEMALHYVRYRGRRGSDIARIGRQKLFLQTLMDQLFSVDNLLRLPEFARQVSDHVDTNMSPTRIVSFVRSAMSISPEEVPLVTVPGEARYYQGISYWFADEEETESIVMSLVKGLYREENAGVTVEVLNGGGVAGSARMIAWELHEYGYNVINIDNAPDMGDERYASTRVYDDSGNEIIGQLVVRALRSVMCESAQIELFNGAEREDEDAPMVRVYVGADYAR